MGPKWRAATRRSSRRKGISSSERQTVAASRPPFASARRICAAAASLSGKNWNPCWQKTVELLAIVQRQCASIAFAPFDVGGHSARDGKHIRTDVYADHIYGVAKPLLRNACHYSRSASDVEDAIPRRQPNLIESYLGPRPEQRSYEPALVHRVERSLYERANGYNYDAVKIFMPAGAKQPVVVHYVEHMPPDTRALKLFAYEQEREAFVAGWAGKSFWVLVKKRRRVTSRHPCRVGSLAWRCIGEATTAVETTKERWLEAEIHRMAGEIALLSPEPDVAKAQAYFERALEVARRQQAKSWELRAAMSLARLWRSQGKVQRARELLAPVYGWFTEGRNTLDLKEAKALLDDLAS
jgi:hypothetical protein